MIFSYDTYRSYLKGLLADRIQRNPAYSLRAMAGQLGLVSSQLSEVINGKANFSLASALKVAKNVGLSDEESEYFCWLVQLESESDVATKEAIIQKLNRLRQSHVKRSVNDLTVDQFKQISEWYHSAILELVEIPEFKFTPQKIAQVLGITKFEAEVAIERLARLDLLIQEKQGSWKRIPEDLRVTSPTQNSALRLFYRQMMQKASEALDTQSPGERISGYETVTFSPEALPEANKAIEKFFDEIVRISRKYPRKKRVYHLLVHFFDLTYKWKGKYE